MIGSRAGTIDEKQEQEIDETPVPTLRLEAQQISSAKYYNMQ